MISLSTCSGPELAWPALRFCTLGSGWRSLSRSLFY